MTQCVCGQPSGTTHVCVGTAAVCPRCGLLIASREGAHVCPRPLSPSELTAAIARGAQAARELDASISRSFEATSADLNFRVR